jgi:hypothetical protein
MSADRLAVDLRVFLACLCAVFVFFFADTASKRGVKSGVVLQRVPPVEEITARMLQEL